SHGPRGAGRGHESRLRADPLRPRARRKGGDWNQGACNQGASRADRQCAGAEGDEGRRPPVKSDGAGNLARPGEPASAGDSPRGSPGVPLIDLKDVTKTYRSGELDVEVLHGV